VKHVPKRNFYISSSKLFCCHTLMFRFIMMSGPLCMMNKRVEHHPISRSPSFSNMSSVLYCCCIHSPCIDNQKKEGLSISPSDKTRRNIILLLFAYTRFRVSPIVPCCLGDDHREISGAHYYHHASKCCALNRENIFKKRGSIQKIEFLSL
jgi:hypothetical protein